MSYADGSTGTVHYLANGHKGFPKERLEVFCGGRILQLDNFRNLNGFGWPGFRGMRLWRQDKGAAACAAAFLQAVEDGGPSPIPFDELIETAPDRHREPMTPVGCCFHTVRHLKPVQIYGRLWRPRPRMRLAGTVRHRAKTGNWAMPIRRASAQTGGNRFRFLNQERQVEGWNDGGIPKLWLYNLHYFEAPDPETDAALGSGESGGTRERLGTISTQPANCELDQVGAWPGARCRRSARPAWGAGSSTWQARSNTSCMANHVIANAKALIFAGRIFEGCERRAGLGAGCGYSKNRLRSRFYGTAGISSGARCTTA